MELRQLVLMWEIIRTIESQLGLVVTRNVNGCLLFKRLGFDTTTYATCGTYMLSLILTLVAWVSLAKLRRCWLKSFSWVKLSHNLLPWIIMWSHMLMSRSLLGSRTATLFTNSTISQISISTALMMMLIMSFVNFILKIITSHTIIIGICGSVLPWSFSYFRINNTISLAITWLRHITFHCIVRSIVKQFRKIKCF